MRGLLLAWALAGCAGERVAGVAQKVTIDSDGGAAALTWVDFAVVGCPRYDPARPSCQGPAPLELRFAAVAPAPVTSYLWTFSDGSDPVVSATPSHRFRLPGSYSVSLTVGGGGGTAVARRDTFVTVTAAPEGAACEVGGQCSTGLECMCGAGCPGRDVHGFCARPCDSGTGCGTGDVCVDLGPRGDQDDGWPSAACLHSCTRDTDCESADSCRELPGTATQWARACFPRAVLGDEGASCVGAGGAPDDHLCLGGDCASYGARGVCAGPCDSSHPCPSYALCAIFTDGDRRCLARCSTARPCDGDPFLGCQASNPTGRLGFTLFDRNAKVCSPKRCTTADACGPDGECVAGFCRQAS